MVESYGDISFMNINKYFTVFYISGEIKDKQGGKPENNFMI